MSFFQNKVVIITGSSMGIGKELAFQLGQLGARLVLNGRNEERLERTRQQLADRNITVTTCPGDVSDFQQCQSIVAHALQTFGRLDMLINNAGLSSEGAVEDQLPAIFQKLIDVNFIGSVYMTKAALAYIRESRGSILFISSVAGIHGLGNYAAYSSSKMALTAFVQSLRKENATQPVHLGIAYVAFTENDAQKTIYAPNGQIIPQPSRTAVRQTPVSRVASRLIRMLSSREREYVFSPLGKMVCFLNRLSPQLMHYILLNVYRKTQG